MNTDTVIDRVTRRGPGGWGRVTYFLEAPRFSTQTLVNSFYPRVYRPGQLNVEPGVPESPRAELRVLGHAVTEIGACGIGAVVTRRDPETGVLSAGADPRRPTYALAW
jgi:gamma-glutamyltranspeptidase/glutathione hydrolase